MRTEFIPELYTFLNELLLALDALKPELIVSEYMCRRLTSLVARF